MSEQNTNAVPAAAAVTPQAPVPATPDLATEVSTPNRFSTYEGQRRSKMEAWLNAPVAEEPAVGDTPTAEAGDAAAVIDEPPTQETIESTDAAEVAQTETPIPQGEAVEGAVETPSEELNREPKHYSVKAGDQELPLPADAKWTYKADGELKERTTDDLIRFAQLGENYDRRSRDLATRQRTFEETSRAQAQQQQQQFLALQNELFETARRFAEDEDFREEYLEEYERLRSNPQELEIRQKAARAEQYERELQQINEARQAEWNRQVWSTVDTIIGELKTEFPYADENRVREQFYKAFNENGQDALSEYFLRDLVRSEHEAIERIVRAETEKVQKDLAPVIAQARTQAAVDTRNQITDQALKREQTVRSVPTTSATPTRAAAQKIESYSQGSKRLKDWANS